MKAILIPTDFSKNARNAMNYAFNLFQNELCKFILLNTYMAPYSTPEVSASVLQILKDESENGLQNELELINCSDEFSNLTIETKSEYGALENNIEHLIEKEKIDFIVMGTQGASGLEEILIGSNTYSVVNSVDIPVIVVPANKKFDTPQNILLASDYKRIKHKHALSPLVDLCKKFSSKINILNIHNEDTNSSELIDKKGLVLNKTLKEVPHEYFFLQNNDVESGIEQFAKEQKTNLMVSIRRHHNIFEKLFKRSITEKLTMHTNIPMLILHE